MKPSLYIETTVVSYLTARPSLLLIEAARQQLTAQWWEFRRMRNQPFTSIEVLREARRGDPDAAARRVDALRDIELLPVNDAIGALAMCILNEGHIPAKAKPDALHLAIASVHGMDGILTWNFRHLANPQRIGPLHECMQKSGYRCPTIYTPDDLMLL